MKKKILTVLISVLLAFTSVLGLTACNTQGSFTVTFEMDRQGARLASGYEDYALVQTVNHWSELNIPLFVCEDAYHVGWNGIIEDIKSNKTLKAQWSEKTFVINFEPGAADAILVSGSESVMTKAPAFMNKPVYQRKGYTMDPTWGGFNFEELKDNYTITAKWIANEYKINFVEKDGSAPVFENDSSILYNQDQMPYLKITYDQMIGTLPTPIKQDKVFGAWKLTGKQTMVFNATTYKYDYDITLEAVWVENGQFIISYENVDTTDNKVTYTQGETFKLNEPTREGYEFLGWTYEGVTEPIKDVYITSQDTGDKTFTANWKVKDFTIELNPLAGGKVEQETIEVIYGQKVGTLPVPVREGYDFVSWKTENGTLITEDTVWNLDDSSIVLTAVYTRIYTVKFILRCEVRKEEVTCSFVKNTYEHIDGLTQSPDDEHVYIWAGVKEGSALPILPNVKPYDTNEYAFSSWRHYRTENGKVKKVKVTAGTILNEETFPGTYDSGVIELTAYCYALWTPYY